MDPRQHSDTSGRFDIKRSSVSNGGWSYFFSLVTLVIYTVTAGGASPLLICCVHGAAVALWEINSHPPDPLSQLKNVTLPTYGLHNFFVTWGEGEVPIPPHHPHLFALHTHFSSLMNGCWFWLIMFLPPSLSCLSGYHWCRCKCRG